MSEFCACKKGFQTASGVFAQALLAQSVIVSAIVMLGVAVN